MDQIVNTHPGKILFKDFLSPLDISVERLAKEIKLPVKTIQSLIDEKSSIDVSIALRLSRFFGNSPEFWLNVQKNYDMRLISKELASIKQFEVV